MSLNSTALQTARPAEIGALDTRISAATVKFDFEDFIKTELKLNIEHIPPAQRPRSINDGKTGVCNYFLKGHCYKGNNCLYRHLTREQSERMQTDNRTVVCKHWLRGLCKKGDMCEFLHEYNLKKMPECLFFSQSGRCTSGSECSYQHINPESRVKECLWYARGFCKHGAKCRSKHVRKLICQHYRFGFCPLGPNCNDAHPRFDLPIMNTAENNNGNPAGAVPPAGMPQQMPQQMQHQMPQQMPR